MRPMPKLAKFLLAVFVAGYALLFVTSPAFAGDGPRPLNETATVQKVYGVPTRPAAGDGGGLTIFTTDGGTGCVDINGGSTYVWWCDVAVNVCFSGGTGEMLDGGACTNVMTDLNYGFPLSALTPAGPFVTQWNTKHICAHPQTAAACNCPVFLSR